MNRETRLSIRSALMVAAITGASALFGASAAMAENVTLKGKGTYSVDRDLMPLGNGGAMIHATNITVVSVEPSGTGVMFGECAGVAYLSPEAELSSSIYCNRDRRHSRH